MTSKRQPANCDPAAAAGPPDNIEFEIDVNRVVWDADYRREVLAELKQRRHLAEQKPGRRSKNKKQGGPEAS